jgi:hypothetical protein
MATKHGRVESLLSVGSKFVQLRLESGQKVELPHDLWAKIQSRHRPDHELVFVERRGRVFSYVQWVGTMAELGIALIRGEVRESELAGIQMPHAPRERYGPAGEAVARLLAILEELPANGWEQLVAANDAADRAWPPDATETAGSTGASWIATAKYDAGDAALTAVGPNAMDAWRNALIRSEKARQGRHVDPPSSEEWHLADIAWRWQFAAEHVACLLVISAGRTLDATRRDWAPYEPIIPLRSVLPA